MRNQLENDNIIVPFLTQLQNNWQEAPRLLSAYSPSIIQDIIMSRYRKFLEIWIFYLDISGANRDLKKLYESKISNSNAEACWINYQKTSNETYSAAVKDFIQKTEKIIDGVHQQIEPSKNEIRLEVIKITGLFTSAAIFPTIRLSALTQYVRILLNFHITFWYFFIWK